MASLAGTSYVENSSCDGAPPVSVLHIHGTADSVIRFEGEETEPDVKGDGERAFYAEAQDMVTRWSQRAGCDWPENPQSYATIDLDQQVPGSETQAFRLDSGCAEGITVELWTAVGSNHSPGYGDNFIDALVDWLLSQKIIIPRVPAIDCRRRTLPSAQRTRDDLTGRTGDHLGLYRPRPSGPTNCLARIRSTGSRRVPGTPGWRGCPAPAVSPRSAERWRIVDESDRPHWIDRKSGRSNGDSRTRNQHRSSASE